MIAGSHDEEPYGSGHMLAKGEGGPIRHAFGVPQELKSDVEMQPNMVSRGATRATASQR